MTCYVYNLPILIATVFSSRFLVSVLTNAATCKCRVFTSLLFASKLRTLCIRPSLDKTKLYPCSQYIIMFHIQRLSVASGFHSELLHAMNLDNSLRPRCSTALNCEVNKSLLLFTLKFFVSSSVIGSPIPENARRMQPKSTTHVILNQILLSSLFFSLVLTVTSVTPDCLCNI